MGTLAIPPNSRRAYAMTAALLAVALFAQWLLLAAVGLQLPFLFVLPAIGMASMCGGWGPGVLVVAGGFLNGLAWFHFRDTSIWGNANSEAILAGYLLAGGLLAGMGGLLCAQRARSTASETTLIEQVDDLQALHGLHERVALLPRLPDQLQAVLETLCELLQADHGLLSLCEGDPLRAQASVGFPPDALQGELLGVPIGVDSCGKDQTARVIVADTEYEPGFAPWRALARQEGFRAVHGWPLVHHRGGVVFGVLAVHFRHPRTASAREQRLGDLCAGMASVLAERDQAAQRALATSRRMEVALDTSGVPFCLLKPIHDEHGGIRGFRWDYLNAAAARAMGRPAKAIRGKAIRDTVSEGVLFDPALLERMVEAQRSESSLRFETWVDADGRRHWLDVIASPYDGGLAIWYSDITARREQEQQLRDADRRKDEFVATLAHELRNPLAPIRQAAMIARAPAANEQQKRWAHSVIERQVGHMAMLLDDLLDVSRITRGKLHLRKESVQLADVVEAAVEAVRPLLDSRAQELQVHLPDEPVLLAADRLRIAQVLTNLLTNAAKYTQERGHIALDARREQDQAVIAVSDDGAGIAQDALEAIFEMFTQVRGADSTRTGGLGIGLALSRGLVELHGGKLHARSAGLGQGSTFCVTLPCAQAQPASPPSPAAQAGVTRQMRILVADDNSDAAQSLADLLRMEGHHVAVAYDGEEALEEYARFAPEVALLDIGMPRRTGNEVARAIRARPEGARTLLVAITGWGQERDRQEARDAGFDAHFTKPVDPARLLQVLQNTRRNEEVARSD